MHDGSDDIEVKVAESERELLVFVMEMNISLILSEFFMESSTTRTLPVLTSSH